MQHTKFGKTGLQVSKLCLGTMTFGLQCDEAQSHAILDTAAAGGIDFLDAADVYPLGGGHNTAGRTEEIVGGWLQGKRHEFILATKCVGAMGPKPWDQGMSRKHILDADRRVAAAARHRLCRPLPAAQLRPAHADRRGAGGAGHRRAPRQGALCRRLQLAGLQGGARDRPQRAAQPRADQLGAAALQPAVPQLRARPAAALRGGGHRRDPLQPAGRRPAHRQARQQGAAAGGHALPARHRRRALPGALLARAASSRRSRRCARSPTRRG